MRLIRPDSTLPAPSSTKLSTPSSTIASTHSRQRTVAVTCRTSRSRISRRIGCLGGRDVGDQRHERCAAAGCCSSASAIASAAGAISAQWNGAETGSSMARRTPLVLAISTARSIAGAVAGDHDLAAAVVVGRLDDFAFWPARLAVRHRRGLGADRLAPAPCRRRAGRPWRLRRRARPSASPGRAASAAARRRRR